MRLGTWELYRKESKQFFKSLLIKANDNLAVDDNHRSRHGRQFFKLVDGRRIFGYIPLLKNDALLRKKLLRSAAE